MHGTLFSTQRRGTGAVLQTPQTSTSQAECCQQCFTAKGWGSQQHRQSKKATLTAFLGPSGALHTSVQHSEDNSVQCGSQCAVQCAYWACMCTGTTLHFPGAEFQWCCPNTTQTLPPQPRTCTNVISANEHAVIACCVMELHKA
jgi:hypothetical protein